MSVVPLSSPLSSSTKHVEVNNEKDSSSVSTLLSDYTLLNSIVDTNQFEKTLQIYSLMLNSFFNDQQTNYSFQILLNQFIDQSSQIISDDLQELIQIFQNLHFHSLISSYDLILQQHYNSSQINSHLSDEETSRKKDHVSSKRNIAIFFVRNRF